MNSGLYIGCFLTLLSLVVGASAEVADVAASEQWPSFRGPDAAGVSEQSDLPISWNVQDSTNIAWKTPIPGLGHSSPIVWDDRVFVTTAVSGDENPELKVGLYGDITPVEGDGVHEWKVYCVDKSSGEILWERTAHTGIPRSKRHPKSTHANSTPATDGKHLVAFFGSEGLYCYDLSGTLLWSKDFGVLRSGFFRVPSVDWGFASSPIIHEGVVLIQCDVLDESYIAALDVETGEELWRTARDDVPTWSTPAVHTVKRKTRVVVNGFKHIGGYDFKTGKEVWNLTGGGDVPVPTPIFAHGLIFIGNAHGRRSPIYAIKENAKGDISFVAGGTSNDHIVWSIRRGASYMQTPIVYGDYLFSCRDNGRVTCFNARTGEEMYSEKMGPAGLGFSASPVAASGKLYYTSEKGNIFVIPAAPHFEVLAENHMNEICMATPAISGDTLFFRTQRHLVAVSKNH